MILDDSVHGRVCAVVLKPRKDSKSMRYAGLPIVRFVNVEEDWHVGVIVESIKVLNLRLHTDS
jgi:hypothetical protein